MPQGLQVFNADGSIRLDTNSLLGRVFGSVYVAANQLSGSIYDARFLSGNAFLIGLFSFGDFGGASGGAGPAFSQISYYASNGTIYWSRGTNPREFTAPAGTIYYGGF